MWLPFDFVNSPVFEIILISQYFTVILSTNVLVIFVAFIINTEVAIIAQFRILRLKFENIRKQAIFYVDASQKATGIKLGEKNECKEVGSIANCCIDVDTKDSLRDVLVLVDATASQVPDAIDQHHIYEDENTYKTSYVNNPSKRTYITCTETLLNRPLCRKYNKIGSDHKVKVHDKDQNIIDRKVRRRRKFLVNKKQKREEQERKRKYEVEQTMKRLLHTYLEQHLNLLRVLEEFFALVKLTVLSGLIAYCSVLAVSLLYAAGKPSFGANMAMQIFLVSGCGSTISLCCFIIDSIADEAAAIGEAAYSCDWFDSTEEFKRSIRLIMTRTNSPFTVSVASLDLSVATFASITKSGYSYFNILSDVTK